MNKKNEDYDEPIFSMEDFSYKINDVEIPTDTEVESDFEDFNSPEEIIISDGTTNDVNNMNRNELLAYINKQKEAKKRYIKKYQQSNKGKLKTQEASKKHYWKNRENILEKKKIAYQMKKNNSCFNEK